MQQTSQKYPISEKYFYHIWKNFFPTLYTESDNPQCPECHDLDACIIKSFENKDHSAMYQYKAQKGFSQNS